MRRLTNEEFIEKAKLVHGDKYDYSTVSYKNNRSKISIVCPKHGTFLQFPGNHLAGMGCKCCSTEKRVLSLCDFIEKATAVHSGKYDYSKVEYKHSKEKVCIICPEHGEFWQTPNDHLRGFGCPKCGTISTSAKKTHTTKEFIERAREVHGDKYDYSKVEYKNIRTKVCIICPEHGEFWQDPENHLNGCNCPKCRITKLEKEVLTTLTDFNINFIFQFTDKCVLKGKSLDFFIPEHNVAIECQGIQHFQPVDFAGKGEEWSHKMFNENRNRDQEKILLCKENDVKLFHYFKNSEYFGTYENEIHNEEDLKKVLLSLK